VVPPPTVKLPSPLLLELFQHKLSTQALAVKPGVPSRNSVERKNQQLRRRRKEKKRALKVFSEVGNIYSARPYEAKMLSANGAASGEPWKENLSNILLCPDCKINPPNLTEEFSSGDVVCTDCGLVVGTRIIDTRSEWRTFANDDPAGDDPSRVGGPPDIFQDSEQLSTSVAFSENRQHRNLARIQNNANQDKAGRSLQDAYNKIQQFVDFMQGGSNVVNGAKHLYKLTDKHKFLKGKQDAVIAACIFISYRKMKNERTFKEIHNVTQVSKKEIGRVYKQVAAFMKKLKSQEKGDLVSLDTVTDLDQTSVGAVALVGRWVSQLGFKNSTLLANIGRGLVEQADRTKVVGKSPLSQAAACIFMAGHLIGEPKPSSEIAAVAGVSDGTVKNAYKHLYPKRQELVKQEWIDAGAKIENLPPGLG
jgi:transcription initiation factor TFIIB